jgi:hypothetical protein
VPTEDEFLTGMPTTRTQVRRPRAEPRTEDAILSVDAPVLDAAGRPYLCLPLLASGEDVQRLAPGVSDEHAAGDGESASPLNGVRRPLIVAGTVPTPRPVILPP